MFIDSTTCDVNTILICQQLTRNALPGLLIEARVYRGRHLPVQMGPDTDERRSRPEITDAHRLGFTPSIVRYGAYQNMLGKTKYCASTD